MYHHWFEPLGARISRHLELMQNALVLQGLSCGVANPRVSNVNPPLLNSELVLESEVELAVEAN